MTGSRWTAQTPFGSSLSVKRCQLAGFKWPGTQSLLHTTPGIAAYKPLEVELLYNGVGLDVLGIGYEHFPEDLRKKIVDQYPRINFKQNIAKAFLGGFEYKTQTTEGTCNEDICSYFTRNYKRSNFYDQIQDSPFQNS